MCSADERRRRRLALAGRREHDGRGDRAVRPDDRVLGVAQHAAVVRRVVDDVLQRRHRPTPGCRARCRCATHSAVVLRTRIDASSPYTSSAWTSRERWSANHSCSSSCSSPTDVNSAVQWASVYGSIATQPSLVRCGPRWRRQHPVVARRPAGHGGARQVLDEVERQGGVEHRHLDALALARHRAGDEGGEHALGDEHPGDLVGDRRRHEVHGAEAHLVELREAGERLDDVVVGRQVGLRPRTSGSPGPGSTRGAGSPPRSESWSRPRRRSGPGRRLVMSTSASASSRSRTSRPAGALRSRPIERLLRCRLRAMPLSSGCGPPPITRLPSPAPRLDLDDVGAEVAEQLGAERPMTTVASSTTLMPASGPGRARHRCRPCGVTSRSSTQLPSGSSIIEMRTPGRISRGRWRPCSRRPRTRR